MSARDESRKAAARKGGGRRVDPMAEAMAAELTNYALGGRLAELAADARAFDAMLRRALLAEAAARLRGEVSPPPERPGPAEAGDVIPPASRREAAEEALTDDEFFTDTELEPFGPERPAPDAAAAFGPTILATLDAWAAEAPEVEPGELEPAAELDEPEDGPAEVACPRGHGWQPIKAAVSFTGFAGGRSWAAELECGCTVLDESDDVRAAE